MRRAMISRGFMRSNVDGDRPSFSSTPGRYGSRRMSVDATR